MVRRRPPARQADSGMNLALLRFFPALHFKTGTTMRIAGIILIILGAIGLAYGGITYTRHRDTVSVGPISATVTQKETVPIPPVLGGIALLLGIGLLAMGSKRTR